MTDTTGHTTGIWNRLLETLRHPVASISLVLLALWVVLAAISPYFLTLNNILEITLQASVTAILAAGVSLVIFAGAIDLSVGSIFAFSAVAGGVLYHATGSVAASLAASIAAGCLVGILNGLAVVVFRIPSFVVTLGMMGIARGFAYIICDGIPIYGIPPSYTWIGQEKILGVIPVPTVITVVLFIIFHLMLKYVRFGRFTYAIGSNAEAARLSGIKVGKMIPLIFMICGGCAALAGIIESARLGTMQPNGGQGYELFAIGAVFIGGASISGGEGHIFATLVGALLVTTIRNGLNIIGVNAFYQYVANGVIIIAAVALDQARKRS
ncbi:MAG: ABC transporter permease [Planctomycetota bacterium]|jgi:ribose transport system permease protein|nr:ABC transporter permease [Planctomycetota bacterium]